MNVVVGLHPCGCDGPAEIVRNTNGDPSYLYCLQCEARHPPAGIR